MPLKPLQTRTLRSPDRGSHTNSPPAHPCVYLLGVSATTFSHLGRYEAQLLLNQERLQKLPVLERVDAWLATQNELFAAGEYGDSVHACQTLLEAFHETFSRPLVFHKEVSLCLEGGGRGSCFARLVAVRARACVCNSC